jgi:hypothetical protein
MFLFVGAERCILGGLWFNQPEMKNRTYKDIDVMYGAGVKARKFSRFVVVDDVVVPKEKRCRRLYDAV